MSTQMPSFYQQIVMSFRHLRRHSAFTHQLMTYNQRSMTLPPLVVGQQRSPVQLQYTFDVCDEFPLPFLRASPSFSKGAPDPAKVMAHPVVVCLDGGYIEGRWLASWLAWAWQHSRGGGSDGYIDTIGTKKPLTTESCCAIDLDENEIFARKLSILADIYGSPLSKITQPASVVSEAELATKKGDNKELAHFSLLSIGRPGYLRSTTVSSLDAEIDAIIAFLDSLGVKRPVHLVARRLSATAALALAARYPDRVHSVTLISALLGPAFTRSLRAMASELFTFGTNLVSNIRAYQMHRIISGMAATIEFSQRFLTDPLLRAKLPMPNSALFDELAHHPEAIKLFIHYETCFAWGGERRAGLLRDYRLLWRIDANRQAGLINAIKDVPILAFHGELDERAALDPTQQALGIVRRNDTGALLAPSTSKRQLIAFPGTGQMLPPMDVGWKALNFMQLLEQR
ncbi:Alpha/Beta hydrolase protein [Syncephalis fuscata]|nr:Alpha/Beta hydrolase protein [Syncephalis fuscata]